VAFVSRASGCEYLARVSLYDPLAVRMWFGKIGRRSFTMSFDVVQESDEVLVASGFNTMVTVDGTGEPIPIPDSIRELMLAP
jgi:acyl-CoA thioesterase FadM